MDSDFFSYEQILSIERGENLSALLLTGQTFKFIDGLVKSFYSLLLTDLGQTTSTNIFANPKLVIQFMKDECSAFSYCGRLPSYIFQNQTAFFDYYSQPGQHLGAGIPVVSPSVISQQYFCQVPQLKSTGSLIITILVADLVFLQTLWTVFNWVITFGLERRHPEAKHCVGCAEAKMAPGRDPPHKEAISTTRTAG
jgi:hypothetical protein